MRRVDGKGQASLELLALISQVLGRPCEQLCPVWCHLLAVSKGRVALASWTENTARLSRHPGKPLEKRVISPFKLPVPTVSAVMELTSWICLGETLASYLPTAADGHPLPRSRASNPGESTRKHLGCHPPTSPAKQEKRGGHELRDLKGQCSESA